MPSRNRNNSKSWNLNRKDRKRKLPSIWNRDECSKKKTKALITIDSSDDSNNNGDDDDDDNDDHDDADHDGGHVLPPVPETPPRSPPSRQNKRARLAPMPEQSSTTHGAAATPKSPLGETRHGVSAATLVDSFDPETEQSLPALTAEERAMLIAKKRAVLATRASRSNAAPEEEPSKRAVLTNIDDAVPSKPAPKVPSAKRAVLANVGPLKVGPKVKTEKRASLTTLVSSKVGPQQQVPKRSTLDAIADSNTSPQKQQHHHQQPQQAPRRAPLTTATAAPKQESAPPSRSNSPTQFVPEEDHVLPDTSFFQSHCWVCEIRLKEIHGEPCLYGLNLHPVLHVPICSVCCDDVLHSLREDPGDGLDDCNGCGRSDRGELLLCDCSCPMRFCKYCAAQANGGGPRGLKMAETWMVDTDRGWACLVCNVPNPLAGIQIDAEPADGREQLTSAERDKLTLELFEQLMLIENELVECETRSTEDWLEKKKYEFIREFAEQCDDPLDIDHRANEEMAKFEEHSLHHHQRLMDNCDTIQERLEVLGFDWKSYYKNEEGFQTKEQPNDKTWRAWAEQRMPPVKPRTEADSDEDSLSDCSSIVDLGFDDDKPAFELGEGWSKSCRSVQMQHKLREKQEKYLLLENARLAEMGRRVKCVRDVDDSDEVRNDQKQSTTVTSGGVLISRELMQRGLPHRKASSKPNKRARGKKRPAELSKPPINTDDLSARESTIRRVTSVVQPERTQTGEYAKLPVSSDRPNTAMIELPATEKIPANGLFQGSSIILCSTDQPSVQRSISVATLLASKMKTHQIEGIRFMWDKVCADLAVATSYEEAREEKLVGGAILAHFMGLGKTAATISLLHVLLNHPSLELPPSNRSEPARFIKKILLVVPVNTLENWMNEFRIWTDPLEKRIVVRNFHVQHSMLRVSMIEEWHAKGGVLLIGDRAFANISREKLTSKNRILNEALHDPGPDLIVLDEGHTMLKNKTTITDALGMVRTRRRIALTGTPFQNNLREYYRMASWVRPGTLGTVEYFNRHFMKPIEDGMARDAVTEAVAMQVAKSKELYLLMETFTQRRDNAILKNQLPQLQEAILHIRQSPLQRSLYTAFKKHAAKNDDNNFFRAYKAQFLVNNHPGTLLIASRNKPVPRRSLPALRFAPSHICPAMPNSLSTQQKLSSATPPGDVIELLSDTDGDDDTDDEEPRGKAGIVADSKCPPSIKEESAEKVFTIDVQPPAEVESTEELWWKPVAASKGEDEFTKIEQGKKIILLLQILAHSQELGDKVVVFSQSLPTLDFIENILNTDWEVHVHNRKNLCPQLKLGGWEKQLDYYRIDGATSATDRGALVTAFNNRSDSKVFLISIEAGGIGINLCGANRVVLMDNHFNPSISSQAISRCWRYGQEKPVYAYRLLTEGSMEEKIVANLSKKTGLGARVVDQAYPERSFTRRELTEMRSNDTWVQCDACEKWRMLIFETDEEVEATAEKEWHCSMNQDVAHNKCKVPERETSWYSANMGRLIRLKAKNESEGLSNSQATSLDAVVTVSDPAVLQKTKELIESDAILMNLGTLELFETRALNETAVSSAKTTKSMASKLFGKVYYPDLLSTHSTKDLDAAASYEKSLVDKAAAELLAEESKCCSDAATASAGATKEATSLTTMPAAPPASCKVEETNSSTKKIQPMQITGLVKESWVTKSLSVASGNFMRDNSMPAVWEEHFREKEIKARSSPTEKMGQRVWGTEDEPLEILSDSDC